MDYHINLEAVSLDVYRDLLNRQMLLPGRRLLQEELDAQFPKIAQSGIKNLNELLKRLSGKKKLAEYAVQSGVSEEYLILLKREIGSFVQKPVSLADFSDVEPTLLEQAKRDGCKTSLDYWERHQKKHNVTQPDLLLCLCDLVRINGVGAVAARTFYAAGYDSVSTVADADAETMLRDVTKANEEKKYYRVKLGLKDMQFCIDFAKLLMRYA